MKIKKHRHYIPEQPKTTLLDCLDEKSLNVLRNMGCNIEDMRAKNKAKNRLPVVVDKIRRSMKNLDTKTITELKTMCFIAHDEQRNKTIIRPFSNKIIELNEYVNNNPTFRPSH